MKVKEMNGLKKHLVESRSACRQLAEEIKQLKDANDTS